VPRIEGDVIAVLAGTTRPLSGREVARLAGTSVNGTWRALRRLVEHGLVAEQEAGRGAALLFTLNREHLAAEPAEQLVDLRRRFLERTRELVERWPRRPYHVSLFGSAARGDGDTSSDVDFFVVRPSGVSEDEPEWRAQIDELATAVRRWTGNHASISELSEEDLPRLRRDHPPIVDEVERDAIQLSGDGATQLFGTQ
jgi:predicted nucleotidyltransferase